MEHYPLMNTDSPHLVNHALIIHCTDSLSSSSEFIPNALSLQVSQNFEDFVKNIRRVPFNLNAMVICYDEDDSDLAGRVWWGLRSIGILDVWVLDGGIQAWKDAGKTVVKEVRPVNLLNKIGYEIKEGTLERRYLPNQSEVLSDTVLNMSREYTALIDENAKFLHKKEISKFYAEKRLTVKDSSRIVCGGDKVGIGLISLHRMGYINLCMVFEKNSLECPIVPPLKLNPIVRQRASPNALSFHSVINSDYEDANENPEEPIDLSVNYYDIPLTTEERVLSTKRKRDISGISSCNKCSLL